MWKETHAYSLNGVHLIWQYLHDSPNRQIKATAKYTTYMVHILMHILMLIMTDAHMHTQTQTHRHRHRYRHTHTHTHKHTRACTHTYTQQTFPSGETAKDVTVSSSYKHYLIIKENMIPVSHFFQMPCYSTSFTIHCLHTWPT